MTEDAMVGWHHQLNGHEFEQTLGNSGGQGSLGCFSLWGHKQSDTTWRLNNYTLSWHCSKIHDHVSLCREAQEMALPLF